MLTLTVGMQSTHFLNQEEETMGATEIIVFCLILIPFIVIALLLLNGKAAFLIAGYNTMSDDKKATSRQVLTEMYYFL